MCENMFENLQVFMYLCVFISDMDTSFAYKFRM